MPYIGQSPATGEANSFKILDNISSYTLTFDGSGADVVSLANDTITEREHRFVTGQRVTYNDGGGTAITGLSDGVYYIIVEDRHSFKLASSANNAAAGTAINLTGLGVGASHTLNVAFDGVNTKFKATHTNGNRADISQSAQLMISVNGVLQQPHDNTTSPSTGYATDHTSTIIFSAAPDIGDQFFGTLIAENFATFDISDNVVDNFTGDGSTSTFTLSKSPPNNESILVTIDGIVQYPDDNAAVRAYTVSENTLDFASAPGDDVEIQVRHIGFAGASTGGISGFYGRTGNAVLKSTDNIVFNNATASGTVQAANVTVTGDLTVNGTTTTLDTDLIGVDKLEVAANNTTVAAAITQTGTGDILNLYDGAAQVVTVTDGGNVGIGSESPVEKLVVAGDARITGILTVGSSSLTLDGTNNVVNVGTALTLGHTQGIQFHTQSLHSQGLDVNNINVTGIGTFNQVSLANTELNIRLGDIPGGFYPDSTDGGVVLTAVGSTTGSAILTELDGKILTVGNNITQISGIDTSRVGAFYRIDTRPSNGNPSGGDSSCFSVKGRSEGETSEYAAMFIDLNSGNTHVCPTKGKVGIGTDNPSFGQSTPISTYDPKLGVEGSIIIGNLSTTATDRSELQFFRRSGAVGQPISNHDMGRIAWYGSTNDNDNSNLAWSIGVTPDGGGWTSGVNRKGFMTFNNHDGEKLRITSAGLVGIGTDNPGSPVDIANGDLEFSNKANSSVTQTIKFSDGTQGRGKIQYEHNGDSMVFHTFSSERLRITSDGDLGLGTTSPNHYNNYQTLTINGGNGGELDFERNGTLSADIFSNSSGFYFSAREASSRPIIWNLHNGSSVGERMRLTGAGDVGIGYNNPTVKLHIREAASGVSSYDNRYHCIIEDDAEAYYGVYVPNNGYGGLRVIDGSGNIGVRLDYYVNQNQMHYQCVGEHIFSTTGNAERLRITSDGKVGIGTDNPTFSHGKGLHIADANAGIRIQNTANTGWAYIEYADESNTVKYVQGYRDTSGLYGIRPGNTLTSVNGLTLTSDGKMGVGTDNPAAKFHISGSAWNNTTGGDVIISNSGTVGSSLNLRPTNSGSYSAGWSLYAGASSSNIGDGNIGFWNHTNSTAPFKITQSGDASIANGNLVVASGHGIDFSATSGTGTSELLDDYEEGLWTPTMSGATLKSQHTSGGTYPNRYTKIGRQVTLDFAVSWQSVTGGTELKIGGLPFTASKGLWGGGLWYNAWSGSQPVDLMFWVGGDTTYLKFYTATNGGVAALSQSAISTTGNIYGSITYFV